MEREKYYCAYIKDAEAPDDKKIDEDLRKKALTQLGFKYAEKYAQTSLSYKYKDVVTGNFIDWEEKLPPTRRYEFIGTVYRFAL